MLAPKTITAVVFRPMGFAIFSTSRAEGVKHFITPIRIILSASNCIKFPCRRESSERIVSDQLRSTERIVKAIEFP